MIPSDFSDVEQHVSTGTLPPRNRVRDVVREAHARYSHVTDGEILDHLPGLGTAEDTWFGLAVAAVDGWVEDAGDSDVLFSIQSISKLFVYALAIAEHGHEDVRERVGVNSTGLPFDSVMAVEMNDGHPMNPMVNVGALATTALVLGHSPTEGWERIRDGLSAFVGRELVPNEDVHRAEEATSERNLALAHLLKHYERLEADPREVVDIYMRQCALEVSARDLAVMGATLAGGGVNPVTGRRVVPPGVCRDTLSVVTTSGLYEGSGAWLFEIGIPAKSGVSGGLVAVAPGKGAVGAFSPPLDEAGNSVRSQLATGHLSRSLGLNLFASAPAGGEP